MKELRQIRTATQDRRARERDVRAARDQQAASRAARAPSAAGTPNRRVRVDRAEVERQIPLRQENGTALGQARITAVPAVAARLAEDPSPPIPPGPPAPPMAWLVANVSSEPRRVPPAT